MVYAPGQLLFIAGLPGSGKSHWLRTHAPPERFFIVDDFMAHAYHDIGRFAHSRWYFPLVFALRAGRDSAISDIAFCDEQRRAEAERVMADAVHQLSYRWIYFENAPSACRHNIELDIRKVGRAGTKRLEALETWRQEYTIPEGAEVVPVVRGDEESG